MLKLPEKMCLNILNILTMNIVKFKSIFLNKFIKTLAKRVIVSI